MISSALATTTSATLALFLSSTASTGGADLLLFAANNTTTSDTSTLLFDNGSTPHAIANANGTSYNPVFPSYIRTTSMVFCVLIMCLGVVGNVMVPIVIFKTKDMRNSTNIFLVNLSVADLMVLLVCTPTVLVEVNSRPEVWVLGEEMCKAVPFVELTVAHASVLTILAISFERYYAICMPLKAGYICTKTRASLICLLAWFVAAVFTSPILAITQFSVEEYFDSTMVTVCFSPVESFFASMYFIGTTTLFFFLPLGVLVILYALIARTLMAHPNLMAAYRHDALPAQSVLKYRKQVVVMLGTVVLAFFVCLLPFRVLTLWIIVAPAHAITDIGIEGYYNLIYFCRIMFYINSAINPILYNIMSSKFRGGFLRVCGVHRRLTHKKADINRKNTFNTTSSTNTSSQHTSESLFSRYSSKHRSKQQQQQQQQQQHEHEGKESLKGQGRSGSDIYVRIATQNASQKEKKKSMANAGESFV